MRGRKKAILCNFNGHQDQDEEMDTASIIWFCHMCSEVLCLLYILFVLFSTEQLTIRL